ncbi:MAG TPA: hypothetical protein VJB14_05385 [Planctomycetota bacterium]|nr:hypothetical protein [Planctomycetota bacterium]
MLKRRVAAILAGAAQAAIVWVDRRAPFELGPLFPHLIVAALSCLLVAGVAYWATGRDDTALSFLARAGTIGLLAAFFWFEACYSFSRLPEYPLTLSSGLRPWPRILPGCILPFVVGVLLASLPDNRVTLANPFRTQRSTNP